MRGNAVRKSADLKLCSCLALPANRILCALHEVGGFDFMSKPFRPKELQEKICKLITFNSEFNSVLESSQTSQKVALDAMSLASKYGMIVSFLDTNVETQDIPTLMESLNQTCQGLGLHHAIVCYDNNSHQLYSNALPLSRRSSLIW